MVRCPAIAEVASRHLEPVTLRSAGASVEHALFFLIIKNYWKQYAGVPDSGAIRTGVADFVKSNPAIENIEEKLNVELNTFDLFTKVVDIRSEPLARSIIKQIANVHVIKPEVNSALEAALTEEVVGDVIAKLTELEARQASLDGGQSELGIVSNIVKDTGDRITTGIPWLDSRLGGGKGPVRGSVLGIVAPQACGKTACGVQLAVAQAVQGRHVLLALVEEGLSKAIQRRIWACTMNIPTTLIESCDDSIDKIIERAGLDASIVKKRLEQVDKHLHILDLIKRSGGIDVVIGEIDSLASSGCLPSYVYIDWAGILADREMSLNPAFTKKHDALKHIAAQVATAASRYNNIIAISQQMAGASVQKGPFYANDQYCCADCKTFTELFKYVFVINPRCTATGCNMFFIAKARDDQPGQSTIVKLDGALSQFKDVAHEYEKRGKKFVEKSAKKLSENSIPTEGD